MQTKSNIIYKTDTDYDPRLNTLNIYYTPLSVADSKRQVVVFIHGGGWSSGDKEMPTNHSIQSTSLPRWFVEQGYVFVSLNFRLAESYKKQNAIIPDALSDIAKALKWLTVNIRRYGGKVNDFILLGYSSGAHLASLIATDQGYLHNYRLDASIIKGVIAMDTAHFNIPMVIDRLQYEDVGLDRQNMRVAKLWELIGKLPSVQQQLSPSHHVGPWLHDIGFLLLSAGLHFGKSHLLTYDMNYNFKELLETNGISVWHHHFAEKDHTDFIKKFDIQGQLLTFLTNMK